MRDGRKRAVGLMNEADSVFAEWVRAKLAGRSEAWKDLEGRTGIPKQTIHRVARQEQRLTLGKAVVLARALDLPLSMAPPAEEPHGESHPTIAAPLVEEDVAAGQGRLPIVPEERLYYFRRDFLARHGWSELGRDRFACYKLGADDIASSMYPTVQPESLILVDREPDRGVIEPRSLWLVQEPGKPYRMLKRVTVQDHIAILESDNPHPQFHPILIHVGRGDLARILLCRVLWYATEVV